MSTTVAMAARSTALLVIDLRWAMFASIAFGPLHRAEDLLKRVGDLIDRARAASALVIYVQHNGPPGTLIEKGGVGWQIHRDLAPRPDDPQIEKTQSDAFLRTDPEQILRDRGIGRLVIVGAQTDACIDTTCRRAFRSGYEVMLVSDGQQHHRSRRPVGRADHPPPRQRAGRGVRDPQFSHTGPVRVGMARRAPGAGEACNQDRIL